MSKLKDLKASFGTVCYILGISLIEANCQANGKNLIRFEI